MTRYHLWKPYAVINSYPVQPEELKWELYNQKEGNFSQWIINMLATAEILNHFSTIPPDWMDILLELRSLIARIAPNVTEELRNKGLSYYFIQRGGPVSAGVCLIVVKADHIRLGFIHGAFLPDPDHLLQGDRIAMRYVPITSFDTAPWEALAALIESSSRFDPYTQTFLS
jgi:hypothetical protein